MANTANYNQLLPTVGGSEGTWGAENNNLHILWDAETFKAVFRDGSRAFTGAQAFAAGSAAAPGLAFAGDANTGFYWVGADSFAATLGGGAKVTFSTAAVSLAAGVKLVCPAATASLAPVGLGQASAGVNPSSPANGDLWANADGLFCRIAGVSHNLTSPPGSGVASFNSRTGAVSLTSGDVTGALGFTPVTSGRTVTGTGMLSGGGDLSANRTITLANVANNRILGNVSGGSAVPAALTAAEAAGLIGGAIDLSGALIGTKDVSGDGYMKLGPLVLMWGTSTSPASDTTLTVSLPLTVSGLLEGSVQTTALNLTSSSNCNVEYQYVSGGGSSLTFYANTHGSGSSPQGVNWFAIGLA